MNHFCWILFSICEVKNCDWRLLNLLKIIESVQNRFNNLQFSMCKSVQQKHFISIDYNTTRKILLFLFYYYINTDIYYCYLLWLFVKQIAVFYFVPSRDHFLLSPFSWSPKSCRCCKFEWGVRLHVGRGKHARLRFCYPKTLLREKEPISG